MTWRTWTWRVAALGAAVVMITCTRKGADVGGLELEIVNDGSLAVDLFHVDITTTGASPRQLMSRDYKVPAEATLPNTIGIASNGDPTATIAITVSAYHLNGATRVPLDRRDNLVTQIPTDRVVALRVVLSAACAAHVKTDAATGEAQSDCGAGNTCNPATGQCTSGTVNGSADLNPYTPGDESTPGVDGGGATVCSPGSKQCSGNGVQTCNGSGQWDAAVACVDQTCLGAAPASSCLGVCAPGAKKCTGNGVQTCNATGQWDAAVACVNQTCLGAAPASSCQGACAPTQTNCSGNGVQTCNAAGVWDAAVACVNQTCKGAAPAASCQGLCAQGAKQCSGNGVQTCNATGGWDAAVACASPTPICDAGTCVALVCLGGTSACGVDCIDLQTSAAHCGSCANACAGPGPGTTTDCKAGACGVTSNVAISQAWNRAAYNPYLNFWKDGSLLAGDGGSATLISNDPVNPVTAAFVSLPGRPTNFIPVAPAGTEVVISHYGAFIGTKQDGTQAWANGIHGCCGTTPSGFVLDPAQGTFYAHYWTILDATNGTTLWNVLTNQQGGPWAIDDTYTYVQSGAQVRRYLRATHALQWGTDVPLPAGKLFSSVAVTANSGAVAASSDGNMLAYVAPSGALVWSVVVAEPTAPVITSGGLAVIGYGPAAAAGVTAYRLVDGTVAWSLATTEKPADLLVGDDGVIYIAAGTRVIGVDAVTGAARHLFTNVPPAMEVLLRNGRLYVAGGGKVTAFSVPATKYDPASPWPVRFHDNQRTSSRTSTLAY